MYLQWRYSFLEGQPAPSYQNKVLLAVSDTQQLTLGKSKVLNVTYVHARTLPDHSSPQQESF